MTYLKAIIILLLLLISAGFTSGAFSYFAYGGADGSFVSTGFMAVLFGACIAVPIIAIINLWKTK